MGTLGVCGLLGCPSHRHPLWEALGDIPSVKSRAQFACELHGDQFASADDVELPRRIIHAHGLNEQGAVEALLQYAEVPGSASGLDGEGAGGGARRLHAYTFRHFPVVVNSTAKLFLKKGQCLVLVHEAEEDDGLLKSPEMPDAPLSVVSERGLSAGVRRFASTRG